MTRAVVESGELGCFRGVTLEEIGQTEQDGGAFARGPRGPLRAGGPSAVDGGIHVVGPGPTDQGLDLARGRVTVFVAAAAAAGPPAGADQVSLRGQSPYCARRFGRSQRSGHLMGGRSRRRRGGRPRARRRRPGCTARGRFGDLRHFADPPDGVQPLQLFTNGRVVADGLFHHGRAGGAGADGVDTHAL